MLSPPTLRTVEPEYAPVAGMMGAASLITGIFSGIVFQVSEGKERELEALETQLSESLGDSVAAI